MSMDYNECGIVDVTGRYDTAVGVSKDHAIFEDKGRHREISSAATPRRTLYSFFGERYLSPFLSSLREARLQQKRIKEDLIRISRSCDIRTDISERRTG
jgi:hypothetical protein